MKKLAILLIPLLLLFSCGEDEKLLFHTENSDAFETCMLDNKFTIFCYIDSTDCAPCSMRWLSRWVYFEEDLKKLNTNVALIVQKNDEKTVFETMKRQHLNFPVIFDGSWDIRRDNPAILSQYSVFVVNRKKEVVWKGLPIESKDSWNAFRKTIRRNAFLSLSRRNFCKSSAKSALKI